MSDLVVNPEDRFSHDVAQLFYHHYALVTVIFQIVLKYSDFDES